MDLLREQEMITILGLKAIYDTKNMGWAIEIALDGEPRNHRFAVGSAEDVEGFLEAFEESTEARFDPETGEVSFAFEYAFDEEDDEEDDVEGEDGEEEDEEEETSSTSKKGQ
jgi:hypothetical protein